MAMAMAMAPEVAEARWNTTATGPRQLRHEKRRRRRLATNQAFEAALALARNPSLEQSMQFATLPEGIHELLRFLAGELAATDISTQQTPNISDIVARYVTSVMLYPGAASERVLGLSAGAHRDEARRNFRLLMIWLHPDHNSNSWRSRFTTRVLAAWKEQSSSAQDTVRKSVRVTGRPLTRPVRLSWVKKPVVRENRPKRFGTAAIITLIIAAIGVIFMDNSVRRYLEDLTARHETNLGMTHGAADRPPIPRPTAN
jgi:hypothetical protein